MIKAILIGAGVCTGAMADEVYSSFGNPWNYTAPIPLVGQTMVVPSVCMELQSFEFRAETLDHEVPYVVAVYDWSEADQHIVGNAYFAHFGLLSPGDPTAKVVEMGVPLPAGEKIAVIVGYFPDGDVEYGTGYVLSDGFAGGSFVGTFGASEEEWFFPEDDEWDLLFEAHWAVCKADMYTDGYLNIFDFLAFEQAYKNGLESADFDENGVLNILDFVAFQAAFQACVAP